MTSLRPLLVTVALALATVTGCTAGSDAVSQDVKGAPGYAEGDASTTWVQPGDREQVNGVSGETLDGTRLDLASLRGHVVVVNFWFANCVPCRTEAQSLGGVYADRKAQGVRFLGIDVRDGRAVAQAFVAEHHVAYPTILDPDGTLGLRFPNLPPNATPTTIVLDRQGRIAARHSGSILYTTLRGLVDDALAEPASA